MANINLKLKKSLFNKTYYPYLTDYSHRYEVYYGGAGSGKSVFIAQKLLIKACNNRRKILVIRKVGTTIKDSVYQLIIDMLKSWEIYSYCEVNKSTYTITLPNDSIILFKGMDDSEKIKSITDITDIWCEEATELLETDYDQLDLRLRANVPDLQLLCSFNPVSKANWVYKKWFEKEEEYKDTFIIKTTYKDNRFLPESYIKALEEKVKTNYTYYRIYALGEFASLNRLVYQNWKVEDFDYHNISGETAIGMDFGFSNDLSTIVASIINQEENRIYVFKAWGDTGKTNDDLALIISSLGFAKSRIIADSAEPKSIEELKRKGIQRITACTKGKDSILYGIQKLQQYQLIIHPSATGVIMELENYSWAKDKDGNYLNQPIDDFNHYLDALRYSLQVIDKPNKLKTISKSKLSL